MRGFQVAAMAVAGLVAACAPVFGATPDWGDKLTHAPIGPHRAVPPCEVTFDIGWNRILSAGQVHMTVGSTGRSWTAKAKGGTTGLARKLWRYDVEMASTVDKGSLHSQHAELIETDSAETCRYTVDFEPRRVVTETTIAPHRGPAQTSTNVMPYGPVDDLLGVILYVRSLELTPGQKIVRVVQPWDRPYVATFDVLGRQTLSFQGRKTSCLKIAVQVQKIDRKTLAWTTYGKVKKATIWLSEDELRLPIELRAEIWIGYVSARIVKLKMLGSD